jgi:hypothetical protein
MISFVVERELLLAHASRIGRWSPRCLPLSAGTRSAAVAEVDDHVVLVSDRETPDGVVGRPKENGYPRGRRARGVGVAAQLTACLVDVVMRNALGNDANNRPPADICSRLQKCWPV